MDLNLISVLSYFGLHILSLMSCLRFLCAFRTFEKKNLALNMISVLSVGDLFFHSFAILLVVLPQDAVEPVREFIINFGLRFASFCSASIAIVIYKSLTNNHVEDSEKFYKWNLFLLVVFATLFTSLWNILSLSSVLKQFYLAAVPMLICLGIVIFFFVKSLLVIRVLPKEIQRTMKSTVQSLFLYPFAQLLFLTPAVVIAYFTSLYSIEMADAVRVLLNTPLAMVGFVNTLIFLIQQKGTQNLASNADKLGEINATLSSIEHTEHSGFYHNQV